MASGISVNGFAWPAIDVRPESTETTTGVATSVGQRIGRGDHMGWGGGGWIVMVVLMVLFWGGVLGIAAWAIHSFSHRGQRVRRARRGARHRSPPLRQRRDHPGRV